MYKIIVFSIVLLLQIVSSALAASPYVAIKGGAAGVITSGISNTTNMEPGDTAASVWDKDSADAAGILGAAVGIRAFDLSRFEIEYMYRGGADYNPETLFTDSADRLVLNSTVKSQSIMALYTQEFLPGSSVRPFISAGLGMAINHTEATIDIPDYGLSYSGNKTVTDLAWTLGAGAAFRLSDHWGFDTGVRYVDLGKAKWRVEEAELTADLSAVETLAAVRYEF